MPNGTTHCALAIVTVGGALARNESLAGQKTLKPLFGAALAGMLGTLPDKLEPALGNPHHRQFLHSVTFAVACSWYGWQVWNWKPENEWEKALRFFLLVGCGAYMSHLAADAFTRRSLPLVGKINC